MPIVDSNRKLPQDKRSEIQRVHLKIVNQLTSVKNKTKINQKSSINEERMMTLKG